MGKMHVGEKTVEKWHLKPLPVEEGNRVRFTYKAPKSDVISEKVGTVDYIPEEDGYATSKENYARVDIDDAGMWVLDRGTVSIKQEGRSNRRNGTLIDVENLPQVGMKAIAEREVEKEGAWDKPIVGEVTEVNLENDTVRFQREFNPTNLSVRFEELTEVK